MGRRRKRSDTGYGYLILGVLLLAALGWLVELVKTNQDAILNVVIVITIVGVVILIGNRIERAHHRRAEAATMQKMIIQRQATDDARRQDLMQRYGDIEVVDAIMGKRVRIGMTREQLIESWGPPHDIKQTILKTKRKEEFKYTNVGVGRFLSRVYLEDDTVVGWKQ